MEDPETDVWKVGKRKSVQREWETVWRGKYPQLVAGGGRINNKENLSLAAMGWSRSKKKNTKKSKLGSSWVFKGGGEGWEGRVRINKIFPVSAAASPLRCVGTSWGRELAARRRSGENWCRPVKSPCAHTASFPQIMPSIVWIFCV